MVNGGKKKLNDYDFVQKFLFYVLYKHNNNGYVKSNEIRLENEKIENAGAERTVRSKKKVKCETDIRKCERDMRNNGKSIGSNAT